MTTHPSGTELGRTVDDGGRGSTPLLRTLWLAAVATTAVLAVVVFTRLTAPEADSDILVHARIALLEVRSGRWFTYTLWTPVLIGVAAEGHLMSLRAASVVLLTIAVVLKLVLSRRAFLEWGGRGRLSVAVAFGMILATPVLGLGDPSHHGQIVDAFPRGSIYLGRISATVWHNSTSIASIPAILLATMVTRRALAHRTTRSVLAMGGAIALSALVKPNWSLAALPVFLVMLVIGRRPAPERPARLIALGVAAAAPTAMVLAVQLLLVRSDPFIIPSSFSVDPLEVWRYYARSPLRAWVQSLAFPLLATATTLVARRRGDWWLGCCWAVMIVSTVQLAVLGERNRATGTLILDGNWFWGPQASALVLFLAAAASLATVSRQATTRTVRVLVGVSWVVLATHVATGLVYIVRLFQLRGGFAT